MAACGDFYCMRVSSGDYFSKTNVPRSGATKYGILKNTIIQRKHDYFIPQAPTLALTSSRKDVTQLGYFQIL